MFCFTYAGCTETFMKQQEMISSHRPGTGHAEIYLDEVRTFPHYPSDVTLNVEGEIYDDHTHSANVRTVSFKTLFNHLAVHPFIHSGYFYSASSNLLLLRGASDTARILCRNFTPKRHMQLWVKDLPMFLYTWRLERESNPWPIERKAWTPPKHHHVPQDIKTSVHSSNHSYLIHTNVSLCC